MSIDKHLARALAVSFLLLQLSGCATEIKPWERGFLAEDYMAVEPDALERTIREQIVSSKEGSEGGHGVVGGGCGCN